MRRDHICFLGGHSPGGRSSHELCMPTQVSVECRKPGRVTTLEPSVLFKFGYPKVVMGLLLYMELIGCAYTERAPLYLSW